MKQVVYGPDSQAKRILSLMDEYEALHAELAPILGHMDAIKKEIVDAVKCRADFGMTDSMSNGNVTATYRSGYTRESWDSKALIGYAAAHPEILPFRKETTIAPSVAVKVKP